MQPQGVMSNTDVWFKKDMFADLMWRMQHACRQNCIQLKCI